MVEDNWLHYQYAGLGPGTSHRFEDFKIRRREVHGEVDAKTVGLFGNTTNQDLRKTFKRSLPNGEEEVLELEQVLYHYGEIFAEFWKMNVDALYYSYLAYAREKAA
jgi:hypothetical protein